LRKARQLFLIDRGGENRQHLLSIVQTDKMKTQPPRQMPFGLPLPDDAETPKKELTARQRNRRSSQKALSARENELKAAADLTASLVTDGHYDLLPQKLKTELLKFSESFDKKMAERLIKSECSVLVVLAEHGVITLSGNLSKTTDKNGVFAKVANLTEQSEPVVRKAYYRLKQRAENKNK